MLERKRSGSECEVRDWQGIKTKEGNVLNIPYKDESFDIIICVEALEHSLNPQNAINEMLRVLMKNGKIIIIDKNLEKWQKI